jgi:hypothetical protein
LANITIDLSHVNTTTCQDDAENSGSWGDQFRCSLATEFREVGIYDPSMLSNIQSDDLMTLRFGILFHQEALTELPLYQVFPARSPIKLFT